ncbi:unnamed protein product, partial [Parascedosporium putredinis]
WNFPAAMITRKIGPALAAGCTVVCKTPGETPYTALALAELAHRAGIPKGVVNFVTSHHNTPAIGEAMATSPIIKKLSFTGSTNVGKILMKQASGTLKKLSFELGGNAPFIVFDDADVDLAVTGAIASKFRSSGQTCICANRIFFKVGNGFADGITHGPLIHGRAVDKVREHVKDAQDKGAKLTVGGSPLPDVGDNFFEPTVLTGMNSEMALASEETFGPVAGLFPFKSEAEVMKLANDTNVGLAGYVYSRDSARIYRVAEHLEVGMIGVNTGLISDTVSPFGGVKESGFGREGSLYGIEEFQTIKTITLGGMGTSDGPQAKPLVIEQLIMRRNLLRPAYGLGRSEFYRTHDATRCFTTTQFFSNPEAGDKPANARPNFQQRTERASKEVNALLKESSAKNAGPRGPAGATGGPTPRGKSST